ncbi:hypothetical protein Bca52824_058260 [Brassica carinata]|uniref:Uncharacterized protein n=1 Tax=Brassica carinata TaxID=52824 RepID=A0A8X7QS68_BRACI|nr:hypothetical protein Bca52824_058260 [Brassica carinata]
MSKRSASSVPAAADRARLKRRMDSLVSRSDNSLEPCEGSDSDLMAPLPLSCVYAAPPIGGSCLVGGRDSLCSRGRREHRSPGTTFSRRSLPGEILGQRDCSATQQPLDLERQAAREAVFGVLGVEIWRGWIGERRFDTGQFLDCNNDMVIAGNTMIVVIIVGFIINTVGSPRQHSTESIKKHAICKTEN